MELEILRKFGKPELATLYIGRYNNEIVEFVESVQPPFTQKEKWVLILSTLYGCPIGCLMCDAGEYYHGKISKKGMWQQLHYMISAKYPDLNVPVKKFKIQFARMGEPSLNEAVLELLADLPHLLNAPGLIPCISTVAPVKASNFFKELLKIKQEYYRNGHFQLQFSIHSTNQKERRSIIPIPIWTFDEISHYGNIWHEAGDRKITLNFAVGEGVELNPENLIPYFDPEKFLIKITPINPTNQAKQNKLNSKITSDMLNNQIICDSFRKLGYETILSIGEWEENQIGSNCGQYATKIIHGEVKLKENYTCSEYEIPL
ncbi:MAG: radical SAM protein [Candidatus Lokiarchaeota archaeon]|nr:radical SAM protein [Candidatus Harpocratesius repetitus]